MLPTRISLIACMIASISFSVFAAEVQAISGDTFFANGRAVKVLGVQCPAPDTEDGLQAKRIANPT